MGGCIPFFFSEMKQRYEEQIPPSEPPDQHIIPSYWNYLLIGFYIFLVGIQILILFQFGNIIFYPFVFLTAYFFYYQYRKRSFNQDVNPEQIKFNDLYRAFSNSMWGGSMFAIIVEIIQAIIFSVIITRGGTDTEQGKNLGVKVQLWTLLNAFLIAAVTEEMAKAIILQHCTKLYLPHPVYLNGSYIKTFVWMGLAVGLGFGTMEGILYTCIYGISFGLLGQLILGLIRVFLAIPFHVLTGIIWGMELSRRDCLQESRTWIQMGIKQVWWHGLYDFIEMEYSLFAPSESIALALVGIVLGYAILFATIFFTRRDYRRLISNEFTSLSEDSVQVQELTNQNLE